MTKKMLVEESGRGLEALEARLSVSQSLAEQLELLSVLVDATTFSNPDRAQKYLDSMEQLLDRAEEGVHEYRVLNLLQRAFLENQLYNYRLAGRTYRQALDLLGRSGNEELRLTALLELTAVLANLQQFEELGKVLEEAEHLLHDRTEPKYQFHYSLRAGYFALHLNELSDAIRHFMDAEELFEAIPEAERGPKDWYLLSLLYSGKGHVYEHDDEPEKEIEAFRSAVRICEEKDLRTRLSWNYLNMGKSYMRLQQFDKAREYFHKTIAVEDDLNKQSRASALANLGRIALGERRYEEARKYFNRAQSIYQSRRKPDYYNMALLYMWFGELYLFQGDLDNAEEYFVRAMDEAEKAEKEPHDLLFQLCQHLAELFGRRGNFEAAYGFLKEKDKYLEAYYALERQNKVRELELKYDLERRRREAEKLRGRAVRLRLQALRSQMNPHFIFNVISSIQGVIRSGDVENADRFLQRFSELMRQSLNFSEADFISLDDEVKFLQNYLALNSELRFSGQMEGRILIEDDLKDEMLYVPSMLIQPLVENAVEHGIRPLQGRRGLVEVTFSWYNDDNLLCQVRDNGIGREAAAKRKALRPNRHRSRGMEIVHDRLELLHKERGLPVQALRTVDLKDPSTDEALGTLVEVILPVEFSLPRNRMI